jgi:hypothetical protein
MHRVQDRLAHLVVRRFVAKLFDYVGDIVQRRPRLRGGRLQRESGVWLWVAAFGA